MRPPLFGPTFVVMLLGIPALLLGAGLVRNAVVEGSATKRGGLDALLESGTVLAFLGLVVLLGYYPVLARQRGLPWWPYALFLLGALATFGPMLFWAYWYDQLGLD